MITSVALRGAAAITCRVTGLAWRERTQPKRREQSCFDRVNQPARFIWRELDQRQSAYRENLVRPKRKIDISLFVIAIYDIREITAFFIPKSCFE